MKNINFEILKTIKLLYVEDESGIVEMMLLNIDGLFKKIVVANNGKDGIECFEKEEFDLIITDIKMPILDGISMIKIIRSKSNIPIIITTAFNEIEYLQNSINIGVEGYITKPVDIKKLLEFCSKSATKIEDQRVQKEVIKKNKTLEDENKKLQNKLIIANLSDEKLLDLSNNYLYNLEYECLYFESKIIELTKKESLLIKLFVLNKNRILDIEFLKNNIWEDYVPDSTLRSLIRRVREKLPKELIANVQNSGYKLVLNKEE